MGESRWGDHTWEVTLRDFLTIVRDTYGAEVRVFMRGGDRLYLVKDGIHLLLPKVELDDALTPDVLETLCRACGIPRLDFGLDPEPDE
jgi:hypothetical protein